jgi:hypothetical protein
MLGKRYGFSHILVSAGLMTRSPATGHVETGFLGFTVFKQLLRCFPSSTEPLPASHAALMAKIHQN